MLNKYSEIVCNKVNTGNILKSIDIIKKSGINFEFRTTVVNSQLSVADFIAIGEMIKGADKYYLQKFIPTKTLDKDFINQTTYTNEEFAPIIESLKKYINRVEVR